jgi:hypothetical protein
MHVSMQVRRNIALLVLLAAASACSDATNAPRPAERPAFDIQSLQPAASRGQGYGTSGSGDAASLATDDNSITLRIDPNVSRTYAFGGNWIYFPARSICDPATSGYGPTLWDSPCTPLTQPIDVTVKYSSKGGYSFATFSPELRFVPADARSVYRWVILSLHTQRKLHALDNYSILYCWNDSWIDESLNDSTLRAWLDPLNNSVVRRVKHFSGYMLAAAYSGLGGFGDASY